METKRPLFQPAPRPRPLSTAAAAETLAAETRDLGFARAVTAPAAEPKSSAPALAPTMPAPRKASVEEPQQSIKLNIPLSLADDLREKALRRRVTVRYLILEALSKTGFLVDIKRIEQDGRRRR